MHILHISVIIFWGEEKLNTIPKKNGKLHIYVRQDKYKGELKSHNWVGRAYIKGKQKVSSSRTTNLDEAIPILEQWYDNLIQEKPRFTLKA